MSFRESRPYQILFGGMWPKLLRRIYGLAVVSVVISLATALALSELRPSPLSPGLVHNLLEPLVHGVEDEAERHALLLELLEEADLQVAIYNVDRTLVGANTTSPPPYLRAPRERGPWSLNRRPHRPPPHAEGRGQPPPPPDSIRDFLMTPRRGPPPRRRHQDSGPDGTLSFSLRGPSGAHYVVVTKPSGISPTAFSLLSVMSLLGVLAGVAAVFTFALARPLHELRRATQELGGGETAARADERLAGPFSELAQTFNKMAEQIAGGMAAQKELVANVSHELRTPLARIRLSLECAREGNEDRARRALRDIEIDHGELEGLVSNLLQAARLESMAMSPDGIPDLALDAFAPGDLVEDLAGKFKSHHPDYELQIEDSVDQEEWVADYELMRRAVANVLNNAAKYSDEGSTIVLSVAVTSQWAEVVVTDSGIGISEEDQERLFTPFFRADRSRTRGTGGVGLGLLLVRRILRAHGGDVTIRSTDGVGTVVVLGMPNTGG